ncbi:ATP-binding protein [Streptomyces sioyaensis]
MNAAGRTAHEEPFGSLAAPLRRRAAVACADLVRSVRGLLGGSHHESWPLCRDVRAPCRARRLVREQLARWGPLGQEDICELLVSELVTNALTHGCGPIRLSMSLSHRKRTLRCAIADACPTLPRLYLARHDDEHGRGLRLLDRLAARWGSKRSVSGKTVWFELNTRTVRSPRPRAPEADARRLAAAWRDRMQRSLVPGEPQPVDAPVERGWRWGAAAVRMGLCGDGKEVFGPWHAADGFRRECDAGSGRKGKCPRSHGC